MTINHKLLLSVLATALIFSAVVLVGDIASRDTTSSLDHTVASTMPELLATNRAGRAASRLINTMQELAAAPHPATAAGVRREMESCFKEFEQSVRGLRDESAYQLANMDDSHDREEELRHVTEIDRLEQMTLSCRDQARSILDHVDRGELATLNGSIDAWHHNAEQLLEQSMGLQRKAIEELNDLLSHIRRDGESMRGLVAAAGIVGLGSALAVSWGMSRHLTRRLARLQDQSERLGKGDLNARVNLPGSDEIAQLGQTLNAMAESLAQAHSTLEATVDRANAANTAKSAFLANMSHEIRTPMTAIVGFAETLLDPHRSPSYRLDALQIILRNARHLLDLINDVLDLSKIEADKMTIEPAPCELLSVLGDVVSMMRLRAAEKGLELKLLFSTPVPQFVHTDPLRLRQVLINLVGNAIKFTIQGQIRLVVACEIVGGRQMLRLSVADTGVGMTPEQQARAFQPFSQADETTTRRFGGTGLGLAISRRLVALLGGTLDVTSQIGVGSTFSFTIDGGEASGTMLSDVTEAMLPSVFSPQPARRDLRLRGRVLLAEDGRDNQELILLHLHDAGVEVSLVENGADAVEQASRQHFDVILMDMQMPVMDGYTAAAKLRASGYKLPIIALTAHAMAEDREKCLRAGCTEYLSKPVDRTQLVEMLSRFMAHDVAEAEPPPQLSKPKADHPGRQGGAAAGMATLVEGFVSRLPARVAELTRLLESGDIESLRQVAHRLKGAGGGYGFTDISVSAAALENRIKNTDPLALIAQQVQSLVSVIRQIEGYDRSAEVNALQSAGPDDRR